MLTDKIPQQAIRIRLLRAFTRIGLKDEYFLVLVSILIGGATGVFAHLFFDLIEWVRDLSYGHDGAGGLYAGRVWMILVLPTLGALIVGFITYYFAKEARGHGVPEVMDAMYRKNGEIRPRVSAAKAITSALTIGSGGSAGTEGPIIQIGAAIGSGIGQFLHIPKKQMSIVVACGVSAGIAAIFNAPIAGVLFALEIFLRDFSFRTFSPVVFASVISCSIMHALRLEDVAIFEVSILRGMGYVFVGVELPLFLMLGVMCGLAATAFIKLLYFSEDITEKLKIPDPLKPALGAAILGIIGMITLLSSQPDQVPLFYGNGYPAIQTILGGDLFIKMSASGLIILFVLKMLATCLTLGSGGSGGVFAPSLLMGAALGGAFGMALAQWNIIPVTSANVYALVGMAALVAGTTHAPLTAIVMLYEITREPKVILPVMFAAIIATAGTRMFSHDSIYTLKLRRRGVRIGALSDLTVLRRITVEDVDQEPVHFVHPQSPLKKLIEMASETNATDFVVVDDQGVYQGMVTGQDIRTALLQPEAVSLLVVSELQRMGVPTVTSQQTLDIVLDLFARGDVQSLPIASSSDSSRIEGLITRQAVMRRYQEELDLQSD